MYVSIKFVFVFDVCTIFYNLEWVTDFEWQNKTKASFKKAENFMKASFKFC